MYIFGPHAPFIYICKLTGSKKSTDVASPIIPKLNGFSSWACQSTHRQSTMPEHNKKKYAFSDLLTRSII